MVVAIMKCMRKQEKNRLVVRNLLLTLYHFEIPGDFVSYLTMSNILDVKTPSLCVSESVRIFVFGLPICFID